MRLFSKRKTELPALISDEELDFAGVNYNTVLEYLVGLSGDDYTKICQVAAVYREADHQACQVLGMENEPTTFINPPVEPEPRVTNPAYVDSLADDLLNDEPGFLDMDIKKPKAKKK